MLDIPSYLYTTHTRTNINTDSIKQVQLTGVTNSLSCTLHPTIFYDLQHLVK